MTELEPLSPDLEALFAAERSRPGPDSDVADRLLSRVGATLGFPPPGSGGGGDGGGGSSAEGATDGSGGGGSLPAAPSAPAASPSTMPPPAPLPAASVSGATTGAATSATGGTLAGLSAKPLLIAAVAFAGGAAAGVTALSVAAPPVPTIQRTPPKIVVVRAPSAPATPSPESSISPEDLEPEQPVSQPTPRATAKPSANVSGRDLDLRKERALLSRARTALAKGDGAGALAALDRHAAQFPKGRLAEERASLRVQALLLSGDRSRAKQEADAFKKNYPKSLLKGAVEKSVDSP